MSRSVFRYSVVMLVFATVVACGAAPSPAPSSATATVHSPEATTAPPSDPAPEPSSPVSATPSLAQPTGGSTGASDVCSYLPRELAEAMFQESSTKQVLAPTQCKYVSKSADQQITVVVTDTPEDFEKSRIFDTAVAIPGVGDEALWVPGPRVLSILAGRRSVRLHFQLRPELSAGFPDRAVETARVVLAALP
jgi:hypothetical protein